MKIDLVDGRYTPNEAMELVARLVDAKISFLRDKIETTTNEEDMKMRERRIRRIQSEFHQAKQLLLGTQVPCELSTTLVIETSDESSHHKA